MKTTPAHEMNVHEPLSNFSFSDTGLENVFGKTIQGNHPQAGTSVGKMLFRDKGCTKTSVLALTKDNIETLPTLLSTYGRSSAFSGCTVLDVAKAVSAANYLSSLITLGKDNEVFIGAECGYNNPCEILIKEAEKQFPNRELIILSIGTGITKVVEISNESDSLDDALAKIAASSMATATRLRNKYHDSPIYHRFDVENGLRDTNPKIVQGAAQISAHSRNYIQENEASIMEFTGLIESATKFPLLQTEEKLVATVPPQAEGNFISPTLLPIKLTFILTTSQATFPDPKSNHQSGSPPSYSDVVSEKRPVPPPK
ncbi:hypothetical protein Cpir12675_006438 [Ceratocystis pirilliformis]|uniref:Uncharacterized protein n=1 Tax=Ceratocystis pirilliformis TaxID=259994 RepID=A0ABR3YHB9_9PEZI